MHDIVSSNHLWLTSNYKETINAASVLRYAAARATALGVKNVKFIQADGENLSVFANESFDLVYSSMFLHETSNTALVNVMAECHRLLKLKGLTLHLEQPSYGKDMPLFEQFIRDWDAHNNNEPFWTTLHGLSVKEIMADQGFDLSSQFSAMIAASNHDKSKSEDHGRAAAWHAYGAWKE